MTQVAVEFSQAAIDDIATILDFSAERFGATARIRYEALIAVGLADLKENPFRPTSVDRPQMGVRTYHLHHCRKRAATAEGVVNAPRHILVYELASPSLVRILRVLHEAMDLERHIPPDQDISD